MAGKGWFYPRFIKVENLSNLWKEAKDLTYTS